MIIAANYLFFLLGLSSLTGAAVASAEVEVTFLSFEAGNIDQATFDKAAGTFISGPDEVNPLPNIDCVPSDAFHRCAFVVPVTCPAQYLSFIDHAEVPNTFWGASLNHSALPSAFQFADGIFGSVLPL